MNCTINHKFCLSFRPARRLLRNEPAPAHSFRQSARRHARRTVSGNGKILLHARLPYTVRIQRRFALSRLKKPRRGRRRSRKLRGGGLSGTADFGKRQRKHHQQLAQSGKDPRTDAHGRRFAHQRRRDRRKKRQKRERDPAKRTRAVLRKRRKVRIAHGESRKRRDGGGRRPARPLSLRLSRRHGKRRRRARRAASGQAKLLSK